MVQRLGQGDHDENLHHCYCSTYHIDDNRLLIQAQTYSGNRPAGTGKITDSTQTDFRRDDEGKTIEHDG